MEDPPCSVFRLLATDRPPAAAPDARVELRPVRSSDIVTAQALDRVLATGAAEVRAAVTDGNAPSERVLRSLGFVRIGPT